MNQDIISDPTAAARARLEEVLDIATRADWHLVGVEAADLRHLLSGHARLQSLCGEYRTALERIRDYTENGRFSEVRDCEIFLIARSALSPQTNTEEERS